MQLFSNFFKERFSKMRAQMYSLFLIQNYISKEISFKIINIIFFLAQKVEIQQCSCRCFENILCVVFGFCFFSIFVFDVYI